MNERDYLSPVVRGWKKRQMAAEAKQTNGQTREERNKIAETRRKHREWEEEQARKARAGIVDEPEVPEPPIVVPEQEPVEEMDRDELIAELQAAGQTVHPASKDETLRRKVEALR